MKPILAGVVGLLLALALLNAGQVLARQKPGPVTIRGIVGQLHAGGFTLRTTTHGMLSVTVRSATSITQKGHKGRQALANGDHVGVRGFLSGHSLTAIYVHIYPVKPKPFSLSGTVASLHQPRMIVRVGAKLRTVYITGSTAVTYDRKSTSFSDIRVGDRVDVRAEPSRGRDVALTVRVLLRKSGPHLQIRGTVEAVSSSLVVISSAGKTYRITLNRATVFHLGNSIVNASSLKRGSGATVYACCAGVPLVATSIHILKATIHFPSREVRGTIVSLGVESLTVSTSSGNVTVALSATTIFEVSSKRVARVDVWVGDDVTIRALVESRGLHATRVHVLAASRRPRSIVGTVKKLSSISLTIQAKDGKRTIVSVGRGTPVSLNGGRSSLGGLKVGDHVRVRCNPRPGGVLLASAIVDHRPLPKKIVVHGTLTRIEGGLLIVTDAQEKRFEVRLGKGVRPLLHGKPAPRLAVFVGVHVSVDGLPAKRLVIATSFKLTVTERTIKGRIQSAGASGFSLPASGGGDLHIDIPAGARLKDGKHFVRQEAFCTGCFVKGRGYEESAGRIRAFQLSLQHPKLDISATTVHTGASRIRTSAGEVYDLHFVPSSAVTLSASSIVVSAAEVPNGTSVHVRGTVDSSGELVVASLSVRLRAVTLRGSITELGTGLLTIDVASASFALELIPNVAIDQGSHTLTIEDVVIGDDVTAYGYQLSPSKVLTRKLLIHRKLVGLDGVIASVSGNEFLFHTTTGDQEVFVSATTIETGTGEIVAGASVHVTGYLRGDGAILATRLKFAKAKKTLRRQTGISGLERRSTFPGSATRLPPAPASAPRLHALSSRLASA